LSFPSSSKKAYEWSLSLGLRKFVCNAAKVYKERVKETDFATILVLLLTIIAEDLREFLSALPAVVGK